MHKIGKIGERKNGNYGLYKGHKNQDFMAKYSTPPKDSKSV